MVKIRTANISDLIGITDIYNEVILNSNATFDTEIKSIEQQKKWYTDHGPQNPIIIAEENRQIVGWASLSKYSTRCAYSDTAELSVYVKKEKQGKGIGKKLMENIVKEGEKVGLHAIISRITDGNKISVQLHENVGFKKIGIMKEVGFKFGKRLDVLLMEKVYK